jgi:hypothetical protein
VNRKAGREVSERSKIGDDNVVVGQPPDEMGSGNTIVNIADARANTILNQGGLAIGRNARADATTIAIGTNAMAGTNLVPPLEELRTILARAGDADAAHATSELIVAIQAPVKDERKIQRLVGIVRSAAATAADAVTLMPLIVEGISRL